MIVKIHEAVGLDVNLAEEEIDELHKEFGRKELAWIIRLKSIVEKANIEQRFIMLNLLGILDLGPQPDEDIVIAMNRNADAINNINNNNGLN